MIDRSIASVHTLLWATSTPMAADELITGKRRLCMKSAGPTDASVIAGTTLTPGQEVNKHVIFQGEPAKMPHADGAALP